MGFCYCGRRIPYPENPEIGNVYRCECGVVWIWKIRARRWVLCKKM